MNTARNGCVVSLAAVFLGLSLSSAVASTGRTVFVDDSGTVNPSAAGSCGYPNYKTIQAAVDDATVAHVTVCKGKYSEQVLVPRSLTLEGLSGATIQAPQTVTGFGAIVLFDGPQTSRIEGFTVTGATTDDPALLAGIAVLNGADVSIASNQIRSISGISLGSPTGYGIYMDGAAQADITDNLIYRYGYQGIVLFGSGSFASIDGNLIKGQGAPAVKEAQIGINVREGAAANVEDNVVASNVGASPGNSWGILVVETGDVSVRDNKVSRNEGGIEISHVEGTEVRSNQVFNNTADGIRVNDSFENLIVENSSNRNGAAGIVLTQETFRNAIESNTTLYNVGSGILVEQGAVSNTFTENDSFYNAVFDILDENGPPLANTYVGNECGTSSPDSLCSD